MLLSESGPITVMEGDGGDLDILCSIACLCNESDITLRWYYNHTDALPDGVEQVSE